MCLQLRISAEYAYTIAGQTVLILLFNSEPFFSCVQIGVSMFVACCVPLADRRFVWLCAAQTGDISCCGESIFIRRLRRFRSLAASELSVRFLCIFFVCFLVNFGCVTLDFLSYLLCFRSYMVAVLC